jgi:hypothetical protein
MSENYDLDVTFEESEPDISHLSASELKAAVAKLPDALRPVAQGLLVEERTMSDVSQQLAIRQAELVTRLRRAKVLISGY